MSLAPSKPPQFQSRDQQDLGTAHPLPAGGIGNYDAPSLDLWGALARRKFIIFLSCLVACGLGYLDYKRQPQKFSSSTRLMITTRTPPRLVNGDFAIKQESMPRHTNLLTSQLVLSNAINDGELGKLNTFDGVRFPVGLLSNMLNVSSLSRDDDTLIIRCDGPDPEELPIILNQVVHAYKNIIAEDSETVGKDSIELIEKLQRQLLVDKQNAEQRYLELLNSRGLTTVAVSGDIENPFVIRINDMTKQRDELAEELQNVLYRANVLGDAINSNNEHQLKIAALEARSYLGLSGGAHHALNQQAETNRRSDANLLQLITAAENKIAELQFEQTRYSRVFGKGHTTIANIDSQIDYWNGYISERRQQLVQQETAGGTKDAASVDINEVRRQEDAEWILLYKMSLDRKINQLNFELQAVDTELDDVHNKASNIAQDVAELNILKKQIEEKSEANRVILDRLSEIDILASNYTTTKVRLLDPPGNGHKIAPVLSKSLGYSLFIGGLVGLGLALLIDRSDMSFRSPFEILERLKIPVVGKIPKIRALRKGKHVKGAPQLVVANRPGSSVAEAFRDIRTALFFRANADNVKTVLFTSPSPGDGKSTTVSNLAVSIAQTGKSVVLVDADFRRPRVNQYFGESLKPGFMNVFEGDMKLDEALVESELQEGLFLLNAGGRPKNPGELVTSPQFAEIIKSLRDKFDFVLIDSPPVLPVADPGTIAGMVDGVYLVVRIRKGVKVTAQKAKENLDRINPNWMGIIVNGIDENPHYNEYYNYPYYANYHGRYYENQNAEYRDTVADHNSAG